MAPLRDAVRLVDHEDVDQIGPQHLQEFRLRQPFRGDEDEVPLLLPDLVQDLGLLAAVEGAVDLDGVDPQLPQLVDLVLHQRDQGGDDDRGARQLGAGELIAERLAGAGGHDHQRVLAGEHRADDLLLPLPQSAEAEGVAKGAAEGRKLDGLGGHGTPSGLHQRVRRDRQQGACRVIRRQTGGKRFGGRLRITPGLCRGGPAWLPWVGGIDDRKNRKSRAATQGRPYNMHEIRDFCVFPVDGGRGRTYT